MNRVELDDERRTMFDDQHLSFSRTAVQNQRVVVEAWIDMQHNIILIVLQIDFESTVSERINGPFTAVSDVTNLLPVAVPLT